MTNSLRVLFLSNSPKAYIIPVMEIEIRVVNGPEALEQALKLRRQVFVEEQKVPAELECDEYDQIATHFVAVRRNGVIGTARLLTHSQSASRISRMAVAKKFRGRGIGRRLLEALEDEARKQCKAEIVLHAQMHACAFYMSGGYVLQGDEFLEANIRHIKMVKKL